ncbi:hypothetical protein ACOSP7_004687 [Xanthoceras sorbifolium]
MIVHQRGGKQYVRQPIQAIEKVVYEFYTSIVADDFLNRSPVNVKGRPLYIRVEDINNYYGTVNHADLVDELIPHPYFSPYNEDLARDLQRNRDSIWNVSNAPIKHAELHFHTAFRNVYFCFSLHSRLHRTKVTPDIACALFSFRYNLPINIGGEVVLPTLLSLNRCTYNDLASRREEPLFLVLDFEGKRLVRPRTKDENVIAASPDAAVEQTTPLPWAAAMLTSMETRLDGLQAHINAQFDCLDARVGAIDTTLADSQFGQADMRIKPFTSHRGPE